MPKVVLDIPEDVHAALRLPPPEIEAELRKELALALYQRQVLPVGKARVLAEMTRWEFEDLLGKRRIARHYAAAHLQEDILYADPREARRTSAYTSG